MPTEHKDKILTISIAAYNVQDTIDTTLKSLITDEESMKKMEVIVVDDGSKDDTAKIVQAYVDKYPDTFRLVQKVNGGYGSTINISTKIAAGKYFKQLDGGDEYRTENIRPFIEFLEKTDADLVISPYEEVFPSETKLICYGSEEEMRSGETIPVFPRLGERILKMHELTFRTAGWNTYAREIPEHCFYTDTEYVAYPMTWARTVSFFDRLVYRYYLQVEGQSVSGAGIRKHYQDGIRMMWDLCEVYEAIAGSEKEDRLDRMALLKPLVKHAVAFVYTVFIKMGKSYRGELVEVEKKLKRDHPEIFTLSEQITRVRLIRLTGFRLYGVYERMVRGELQ